MEVIQTAIKDVLIIKPRVFEDARGYFFESFSQREFDEKVAPILGHTINFVQDNESMSSYGVMRGLHFQRPPYTQSKLVRCVKGAVLDVAVDIRKGSPTYGQHVECLLCAHDEEGARIAKQFAGHTFNCQLSIFNCQLLEVDVHTEQILTRHTVCTVVNALVHIAIHAVDFWI